MQLASTLRPRIFFNSMKDRSSTISVAVVDDSKEDFFLVKNLLEESNLRLASIEHYFGLNDILAECGNSPDVVILDRCLPDCGLSEPRIREIRAKHDNCGVILHTSMLTPSLRSTAAHEGAIAVIEKGALDAKAIGSLVSAAAEIGPKLHLNQI